MTRRNRFSIGEAVDFAWFTYRSRRRLLTGVPVAMLGAWVVLEIVVVTTQRFGILAWALAHIAFLLCFAGMEVGLLRISLALHDGRNPSLAEAFKHFSLSPGFLAGQLFYLAIILVGLVVLIIPGVFLAARFALFGFQIADGEGGVLRVFRQSADLTRGATGRLAATLVTLFLFNLLGAALLGLGLLVTVPLSVLTLASIHRQLSGGDTQLKNPFGSPATKLRHKLCSLGEQAAKPITDGRDRSDGPTNGLPDGRDTGDSKQLSQAPPGVGPSPMARVLPMM